MRAPGYDACKAARNSATVLLAQEHGTDIKINCAHPAWLKTSKGGDRADMSSGDGARTVIKYATLAVDGPGGGFLFLDGRLSW